MSIPESTTAAVLREYGKPLTLEEVPVPQELEPGALLVEMVASSVCGTDVHLWQGELAVPAYLPSIPGHEMVGRVISIASGADLDSFGQEVRIGDRVLWSHAPCGRCRMCARKQPSLCKMFRRYGHQSIEEYPFLMGAFAKHSYVSPTSGRVKVPDSVSNGVASMSSCALRSVVNAVEQTGAINSGHTVVIQGSGPLGILATAFFREAGAGKIIVVGAPDDRLQLCEKFGADHVISVMGTPDAAERVQEVLDITEGNGADVILEVSGAPIAFDEGLQMIGRNGRYTVAGQLGDGRVSIDPGLVTKKNITIQGSLSGDISHYRGALTFVERSHSRFPFEELLTNEYRLEDINEALQATREMREMKPHLRLDLP